MTKGKHSLEQAGDLVVKACWKACVLVSVFLLKQEASLGFQSFKESIVVPRSEEAELEV